MNKYIFLIFAIVTVPVYSMEYNQVLLEKTDPQNPIPDENSVQQIYCIDLTKFPGHIIQSTAPVHNENFIYYAGTKNIPIEKLYRNQCTQCETQFVARTKTAIKNLCKKHKTMKHTPCPVPMKKNTKYKLTARCPLQKELRCSFISKFQYPQTSDVINSAKTESDIKTKLKLHLLNQHKHDLGPNITNNIATLLTNPMMYIGYTEYLDKNPSN